MFRKWQQNKREKTKITIQGKSTIKGEREKKQTATNKNDYQFKQTNWILTELNKIKKKRIDH